jgi:hypothetical protein
MALATTLNPGFALAPCSIEPAHLKKLLKMNIHAVECTIYADMLYSGNLMVLTFTFKQICYIMLL